MDAWQFAFVKFESGVTWVKQLRYNQFRPVLWNVIFAVSCGNVCLKPVFIREGAAQIKRCANSKRGAPLEKNSEKDNLLGT